MLLQEWSSISISVASLQRLHEAAALAMQSCWLGRLKALWLETHLILDLEKDVVRGVAESSDSSGVPGIMLISSSGGIIWSNG